MTATNKETTMSIVLVNKCYGGFELHEDAYDFFLGEGYTEKEARKLIHGDCPRHLPILIKAFEMFGSGSYSEIKKERISGSIYVITEHDGYEKVSVIDNEYQAIYSVHDMTWEKKVVKKP